MTTTPADRMTAIAVRDGSGPADALHVVELAAPRPRPGELLVKVRAAGVNRPDVLQRLGVYPPPPGAPETLGLEAAGEVVDVAEPARAIDEAGGAADPRAARWRIGDPVCALLGGGGYAGFTAVDARHALPVPRGLSVVEASALPEAVFTVWANVFEHGALRAGETLLVHGATSGIGTTAIQMAKAAGARVVATARGADKARQAKALGADVAVDSTTEDFSAVAREHGGVDVALDMVGGPTFEGTLDALNPGGRIVYIAAQGGPTIEVPVFRLMSKRAVITGSTLRPRSADEKARLAAAVERVVWPWIEAGKVRVVVDKTFPLAEAAAAHEHLEAGQHVGKVVLVV